uniref:TM7S3/TM198-like domain-containing protein n=1 Tax=Esox lucius TaxID=8010 RepID=A0AAY5KSX0_ESOLU
MTSTWLMYIWVYSFVYDGVISQLENRVEFLFNTFQEVRVDENETVQAVVSRIPIEVAFITVQFHTQRDNVTLSYTRIPMQGLYLTAVDSGLLSPLQPDQTELSWFLMAPDGHSVAGTGVILPYTSSDPVPGACNLEFDLDIDPNVYLHYNLFETTIHFAPANLGYSRGSNPPPCDTDMGENTRWRLRYDIYRYFLPENDLSDPSLITSIQSVANVQSMKDHGKRLMTLLSADKTEVVFSSIPGQGVVYSVIVRDPVLNTTSSYIPVHTYACSFTSTLDGCDMLGKISTKIFFTITGLAGLFVCFFGHRFFKCELFCMGFGFAAFFFFVLITRSTNLDYDSDVEVFRSDLVFWVTFSCIVMVVPIFFVRWPREGNIVTCGVVGAYAVVLAVNAYVYTSLSYITLNILKRFLNNNFSKAFTDVPFQDIDFVMVTVWAVLGISGITLQLCRERTRPFFPPSPYLMWQRERERRRTNVLDPSHHTPSLRSRLLAHAWLLTGRPEPAGERTPLLL